MNLKNKFPYDLVLGHGAIKKCHLIQGDSLNMLQRTANGEVIHLEDIEEKKEFQEDTEKKKELKEDIEDKKEFKEDIEERKEFKEDVEEEKEI